MTKQKTNILILEDHDSVRLLLGTTFRAENYSVVTKKDGIEGMAWLAAGNIPNMIILDINMPRLNGLDFMRQINRSGLYKDIPVMMLTANDDEDDIIEAFKLGIQNYVQKPFNPVSLKDKVRKILKQVNFVAVAAA
jgi:DNA-binding response OmpR family regulator